MKAKVIINSSTPTRETLKNLYDVCNKYFSAYDVFYSSKEVKDLKKNKNNIFL